MLVLYEGHPSHIQYRVLKLCHENGIIVICLPSHLSNALLPVNFTVFSSFKSKLEIEIHIASRVNVSIDAFVISFYFKNNMQLILL